MDLDSFKTKYGKIKVEEKHYMVQFKPMLSVCIQKYHQDVEQVLYNNIVEEKYKFRLNKNKKTISYKDFPEYPTSIFNQITVNIASINKCLKTKYEVFENKYIENMIWDKMIMYIN